MTLYRSSLTQHLKNQSKLIAREGSLRHSAALDQACREYGFSTWKQAVAHMGRVEALVDQTRATLPVQVKARAAQLGKQRGYPLLLDEHLAMRYDPTAPEQAESVALERLLLADFCLSRLAGPQ